MLSCKDILSFDNKSTIVFTENEHKPAWMTLENNPRMNLSMGLKFGPARSPVRSWITAAATLKLQEDDQAKKDDNDNDDYGDGGGRTGNNENPRKPR